MTPMNASRIGFVHPPLASFASGGNVYNAKLLEYAGHCGFPIVSLPWRRGTVPRGTWDLLAWDSLFLDRIARIGRERIALLLHYLPSLAPLRGSQERRALQAMEQRAVAQADFAIATGKSVADAVTACCPDKPVFLCEPGVSAVFTRNEPAHAGQAVKLLTVAHLSPDKGHGQLLEILERLRHLHWQWQVVGDCSSALASETVRRLRERAARAGLTQRIAFHGALPQDAVAALMAASDLLIAPSTFEAYGMAVAEAAASGLPVLSNRVGAAQQLIEHGVTGFLATVDNWDSFGRYLQILLEDATLRAAFRANLRHAAVRGWDKTFEDFRAACEAMLQ